MPVKLRINMKALRIAVLLAFALSVAITVWSLLTMRNHVLHVAHVVLITLTFLLIALYLYKSAEIASLMADRELRLRMTVDPGVCFIERIPGGAPIFNACAGALARKGIFVKSSSSMRALAGLKSIAAAGNSESRAGYAITRDTLNGMGTKLSNDTAACPVKIILGSFDPETGPEFDFVLTQDKITHVLIAVFISRLYVRIRLISLVILCCALVAAITLAALGQYTYAAASIAIWSASEILCVHRVIRKTARITFKSVTT